MVIPMVIPSLLIVNYISAEFLEARLKGLFTDGLYR